MKQKESIEIVREAFNKLGYRIIHVGDNDENCGPDIWVSNDKSRPISVEIKVASVRKNGAVAVAPISNSRKSDDLIAIVLNQYVLIEPMKDHLKCCSCKGTRGLTSLSYISN